MNIDIDRGTKRFPTWVDFVPDGLVDHGFASVGDEVAQQGQYGDWRYSKQTEVLDLTKFLVCPFKELGFKLPQGQLTRHCPERWIAVELIDFKEVEQVDVDGVVKRGDETGVHDCHVDVIDYERLQSRLPHGGTDIDSHTLWFFGEFHEALYQCLLVVLQLEQPLCGKEHLSPTFVINDLVAIAAQQEVILQFVSQSCRFLLRSASAIDGGGGDVSILRKVVGSPA